MDIDSNGPTSNCQNGCSTRPSQRLPKISIGIMVDKTPMMGHSARKEDETVLPVRETAPSSQEKNVEEDRRPGITANFSENEALGKQKASPWISARSLHRETPNAHTILFHAKASAFQSDDGLHERLDGVTCEKRREKCGYVDRIEEVAFAAIDETYVLHKGSAEEPKKFREVKSEALRMKLWEALGVASPQSKHISSPLLADENTKISKSDNYKECKIHEVPRPRHDTDTIETDSENLIVSPTKAGPNQTMRRPFTRSLARKKDPDKTLPKLRLEKSNARKNFSSSRSKIKQKYEEKNIFAFDEGEKRMDSSMFAANLHFPVSAQKENEIKSARVEPRRISFPSRSVSWKSFPSDKSLQSNHEKQPQNPSENGAYRKSVVQGTRIIPCEVKKTIEQPENSFSGNCVHSKSHHPEAHSNSSLASSSETQELDGPPQEMGFQDSRDRPLSKGGHPCEKVTSPTVKRKRKTIDHMCSPTFAVNITPTPVERKLENGYCSPILSEENAPARSSESPLDPRAFSSESAMHLESTDGNRDSQALPTRESSPAENGNTAKCLSPCIRQPLSSESLEMDELAGKVFQKTQRWQSKDSGYNKSPFILRHGKRICTLEDTEVGKPGPSSAFPFNLSGNTEGIGSHDFSDQSPENSLARAITQLAVVLERFKAKIKSRTCKKNSEILSSVGVSIRLQLQEVESLIHADAEKFMSLGRSKRKRLESTFLEQQEKLKAIHDKFKEELNQHLFNCKGTLEELEAYQEELKGNVERQKAAHRRHLLQVEEAMEAQLAEAETSISAVHKAARKKMNGLRHALREWLAVDATLK